ncbi:AAA family ATPase [Salegentibacter salegens]|uniref:Nicotinamide-nucleotide adenylyltransferase, NadR type n=1 Tax=Salegentibacter salegens TaxID=143223 RepID=A0A1M7MVH4_9FLAO|nr:ATP-binding protein [Salegentibacter salegens]PRX52510.1 NadR type nicotinamide-nucleotide adenylyltransferase [Salegentibacter salegens]SHM94599.1 nicotinamide-nucleotide adenylyltransferase, NadR type [Salegentibacter salegens]
MAEKLAQRPSSVIKVVLFGPESTGKTSLAEMLGKHYNTLWVEEFMRDYLQEKWDNEQRVCEPKDMIPIAEGQMKRENELTKKANKLLISDTDLLELKVYSEAYYSGFCEPQLLKHALNNLYDLYFLTYIDVPWTPDDLRDKPEDRIGMFKRFEAALKNSNKPYVILKGDLEERFKTAVNKIDELLKNK